MYGGKKLLLVSLLGLAIGRILPLTAEVETFDRQTSPSAKEATAIFHNQCSFCHGEHGEGSEIGVTLNVLDLRSQQVQKEKDETLRRVIKNGRGNMPAVGADLSEQTVNELLRIVRKLAAEAKGSKE